jgi:hypothetical protein
MEMRPGTLDGATVMADRKRLVLERLLRWPGPDARCRMSQLTSRDALMLPAGPHCDTMGMITV